MQISSAALEELFSTGEMTLMVWRNEPGWPVSYSSRSVEDLLGLSAADFVEGRMSYADIVHPDDLPGLASAVQQSVDGNLNVCIHDDYRVRGRDGNWMWVRDRAIIQRSPTGEVECFIGYLLDQTAHRAARSALAAQRDRLQLVLDGTRLGLWDWNPQTNEVVFDANWAEMLGYQLEEIEFTLDSWSSRVHPDDLAACYEDIEAHIRGDTDFYENVHRMRHKDGHWVYILDRGRICERDAEGNPTRFTGTHTDISAQKEAEVAANKASQAKSDFLALMSHEIRTPLHGVLGMLEVLKGSKLDAEQAGQVEVISQSGETLLRLIDDILDKAKIEAREMTIEQAPFEVRPTLQAVHDLYRESALSKGLDYRLDIAASIPSWLIGDAHRIRQVLGNLLSNACKFTEAGHVEFRAQSRPRHAGAIWLDLVVVDSGPGIKDQGALAEPFRQGDASFSRRYGGSGLGLVICQELVALMEGKIDFDSNPGRGTLCTVSLPLQIGQAATEAVGGAVADDQLPELNILVAEDNPTNQLVISGLLKKLGQNPTIVDNGLDAVDHYRDGNFQIVLMDLHMPEMNGFEACRRIRQQSGKAADPCVIAISADAFAQHEQAVKDAEFDGYLTKPFKIDDLASVLRRVGPPRVVS